MMQFTGPGPNKVIRVVKDTTNKVKDKVKDKSGQLVNKVKEENAKIVEKLKGIVGTVGDVVEEFTKSEDANEIPKSVEKEMMQFTGPNKVIRAAKDTTNKVKDKVKDKIVEKLKGVAGTVGDIVEEFTKSEDRNAIPKFVEKEMMQFTGPNKVIRDKTGNIVSKLKDIVGTVGDIVKKRTKK